MKKLLTVMLAGLLVLALIPGSATAQKGKKKRQVVEGTIALPAVFWASALNDGCWGGLHRRIATASQNMAPNGVVGYEFEVDKATWGKNFVLEATGGEGTVDLDLFLYIHYPPLDEWPDDPVNGGTPTSVDFNTREEGGESGEVPENAIKGIVCLYGGPSGYFGYDASFTYTAGKGVKLPKS